MNLPQDSDCLNARLLHPDPFAPLPDWTTEAIDNLHAISSHFLAVSYPYLPHDSTAYTETVDADVLIVVRINNCLVI